MTKKPSFASCILALTFAISIGSTAHAQVVCPCFTAEHVNPTNCHSPSLGASNTVFSITAISRCSSDYLSAETTIQILRAGGSIDYTFVETVYKLRTNTYSCNGPFYNDNMSVEEWDQCNRHIDSSR